MSRRVSHVTSVACSENFSLSRFWTLQNMTPDDIIETFYHCLFLVYGKSQCHVPSYIFMLIALGDQVMLIHINQIGDHIAHLCAMCAVLNCNTWQNTSYFCSDYCHFLLFLLIVCVLIWSGFHSALTQPSFLNSGTFYVLFQPALASS